MLSVALEIVNGLSLCGARKRTEVQSELLQFR